MLERNRLFLLAILGVPMMTTTAATTEIYKRHHQSIICSAIVNQKDRGKIYCFNARQQTTYSAKYFAKIYFLFFIDNQQNLFSSIMRLKCNLMLTHPAFPKVQFYCNNFKIVGIQMRIYYEMP